MNLKLTLAAFGAACATFATQIAAGAEMDYATPESQGVSSRAIQRWIEACEAAAKPGALDGALHGFVIVRHGKVIAEGSWAPQETLTKPHALFSHSKSFTSTAVGFLVDDGKLDIDERVVDVLPDKLPAAPSENLRQLRIRDLLTMNIGAKRIDALRDDLHGDWAKAMLANTIDDAPGTKFRYDSGATYLLAAIVERRAGRPMMDFLRERLFEPLGMKSPYSTVAPTGVAIGGWGMYMTTRDIARFGQFLLQKGVWNGKRLLSSEWIDLATSRQTWSSAIVIASKTVESGSEWSQGYGFQFWRCRHGGYRADGHSGQFTVVLPKEDVVISVHAALGNMQKEYNLVWDCLLPAFGEKALAEDADGAAALKAKCASLALSLEETHESVFQGFDKAKVAPRTEGGWTLTRADGRTLAVGSGAWAKTDWRYTNDNVELWFAPAGTRTIAANGRLDASGRLVVSWKTLGDIYHGRFTVEAR